MSTWAEVCEHLHMNRTNMHDLQHREVFKKYPRGKVDVDECRVRYIMHLRDVAGGRATAQGAGPDLVFERARLAKEQADEKQMSNEVMRGALLPAADWLEMTTAAFGRVRLRLLALPSKMAPSLLGLKKHRDAERIVKEHIYEALDELASGADADDGGGEGDEGEDDGPDEAA